MPFQLCPLCKLADKSDKPSNDITRVLMHAKLPVNVGPVAYLIFTAG